MKKLKAYGNNVIILIVRPPLEQEGIIIPYNNNDQLLEGTIIAVGPGTERYPMSAQKGDRVLFTGNFAQNTFKFDEVDYVSLDESQIFAAIEEIPDNGK